MPPSGRGHAALGRGKGLRENGIQLEGLNVRRPTIYPCRSQLAALPHRSRPGMIHYPGARPQRYRGHKSMMRTSMRQTAELYQGRAATCLHVPQCVKQQHDLRQFANDTAGTTLAHSQGLDYRRKRVGKEDWIDLFHDSHTRPQGNSACSRSGSGPALPARALSPRWR